MFGKQGNNKVKFQDQQLDDYILENAVLKSKLQSKSDALSIMSRELDKCSMERDRFKFLVEQLKGQKTTPFQNQNNGSKLILTNTISGGEIIAKTKDQNNMLKLEVETLRCKLEEATGDIIALRKQLNKKVFSNESKKESSNLPFSDYEESVKELEKIKKKYQDIQLDYRATLDEKEELVSDRDYYKNTVQRLNQQISYILSTRNVNEQKENQNDLPKPIVDIDTLIMENKYLHESITQLQVEKEIIKRNLTKYKTLLENKTKHESGKINYKKGFLDVMTQKQAREFLNDNSVTGLKKSSAAELKSLCLGLFEALNDKTIALQHQRKTNQILANRINELEKTLESWCNGEKCIPIFPAKMLLEESIPESSSVISEDSKEDEENSQGNIENENNTLDSNEDKTKYSCHYKIVCDNSLGEFENRNGKTILPIELQELVEEALAEMKPSH